MSCIWCKEDLEKALSISIESNYCGQNIQFNSKDVQLQDIFIALGEGNNDGHKYIDDALARGASYIIASRAVLSVSDRIIYVNDCSDALFQLALYKRKFSRAKFICITGSVGKTTTKNIIGEVCQYFAKTFIGRGNFNNMLGVMVNLASMPSDIEYAVFELGMNAIGEMNELSKITQPDIAIIVNISYAHIEYLHSLKNIALAKSEILHYTSKDGCVITPSDTDFDTLFNSKIQQLQIKYHLTFGYKDSDDIKICDHKAHRFLFRYNEHAIEVTNSLLPKYVQNNISIAILLSQYLYFDTPQVISILEQINLSLGRGLLVKSAYQGSYIELICDYYNSSPQSLIAALQNLQHIKHDKKIAIIGDMLELGDFSQELHMQLIPHVINCNCQKIVLVGNQIKYIYDALRAQASNMNMKIYMYNDVNALLSDLDEIIDLESLILLKASRSLSFEKIVQKLELKNVI